MNAQLEERPDVHGDECEDDSGFEWIRGHREDMDLSFTSQSLCSDLAGELRPTAKQLGWTAVNATLKIFPHDRKRNEPRPDIVYISRSRLPVRPPTGELTIAPELAVEVVSPNEDAERLEIKVTDYLRGGVDLVWVVYPHSKSIHVRRRDGSATILTSSDTLTGESILPGFALPVNELLPADLVVELPDEIED